MTDAIALAGGGANGAFQVGAVGILLGDAGVKPEIVTGTSVGAINAAYLAHHRLGDELAAARGLFELWYQLETADVYEPNPDLLLSLATDLFGDPADVAPSVYDTAPLRETIGAVFDLEQVRSSGRALSVFALSLNSGELGMWTEDDDDLFEGVMASAAFPLMFPPVETRFETWVDGGVREVAPIEQAIELGATRVFAILTEPRFLCADKRKQWGALDIGLRVLNAAIDEVQRGDVERGRELADEHGVELHVIRPDAPLGDSFDFSHRKNLELIALGDAAARRVVGLPPQ